MLIDVGQFDTNAWTNNQGWAVETTPGFNRSICQKVVNTGQYESEWLIEKFKWPF